MFEDYFVPHNGIYKHLPSGLYTMMQFLDYSYYTDSRKYFFNVDKKDVGYIIDDNELIIFKDFIKTFKLIFG